MDCININRMLNDSTGKIPMRWSQLLDLLGLELVVRRKKQPADR